MFRMERFLAEWCLLRAGCAWRPERFARCGTKAARGMDNIKEVVF